ncbi:MAG: permease [Candidatus Solincola sediminis]|uniref:Permease n=1 Tax=Candidatus Solincola sediminis TaxID=1797199 RepID=A0A1F2WRC9_9ACTN|nr:MAG: permease [Candidatus Solincola sediminis]OFW60226.1 MAG: permease [Candidatus Solincola sediminis]
MSYTAIGIDAFALVCLIASLIKSREKTGWALKIAFNAIKRIGPSVLTIIAVIGLIVGFVPPRWIASAIGGDKGILGVLIAALLGAVLFIPGLIAFPLARSLWDMGAGVTAIAAFITTLTMIGFVFLPLEIKELGKKFTLIRNGLSFITAIAIAVLIGLILE